MTPELFELLKFICQTLAEKFGDRGAYLTSLAPTPLPSSDGSFEIFTMLQDLKDDLDFKVEKLNQEDIVNKPAHYTQGDIECIDAIQSALTAEEFRGYCKGNIIKYTWREKHKGGDESLHKATWYMQRISYKKTK